MTRLHARRALSNGALGFGQAAACAAHARYIPATDANGRAIEAVTPPIRVRFVR